MALRFSESISGKNLTVNQHARLVFKAKPGEKYFLIEEATGKSPKDLEVQRLGDNLLIKSPSNDVEILIEDFWSACRPGDTQCFAIFDTPEALGGDLVGQTIITQEGPVLDALLAGEIGTLGDSVVAIPWQAIAGALVGVAAIGAGAGGGGGGSSGSATPPTKDTTAPSAPELTANTDGSVTVKVPADAETGDSVTVNVIPEGATDPVPVTLTKNDDGSWTSDTPTVVPSVPKGETTATIPADQVKDGSEITATAQDPSDNKTTADPVTAGDNPTTQTDTPTIALVNNDTDGNGTDDTTTISGKAEPNASVELDIGGTKVTVTADAAGNYTHTTTEPVPEGTKVTATATAPGETASNPAETSAGPVDTTSNTSSTAAVTGVTLGGAAADGYLNQTEVNGNPTVTTEATIALNGNVKAGDTVTISVSGVTDPIEHKVTAAEVAAGKIVTNVTIPTGTDATVTVTAKVTALAGGNTVNDAGKEASVVVDTGVPGDVNNDGTPTTGDTNTVTKDGAPIVTIQDGGDGELNPADLTGGQASVEISIPANTKAGDSLIVTINGTEQTIKVTDQMITDGQTSVSFTPAADGETNTVTAKVTDEAGNTSAEGTATATTNTGAVAAAVTGVTLGGAAADGYL
ncbi:MAG: hypothetical protein Q4G42_04910, partial [Neisseria sp.]|nr:hypothetical protein [Neisseria sp.]